MTVSRQNYYTTRNKAYCRFDTWLNMFFTKLSQIFFSVGKSCKITFLVVIVVKFSTKHKPDAIVNLISWYDLQWYTYFTPASIYLFKISIRNTRTMCEICSKLTLKTSEWRHWLCSGVSIASFENISYIVLGFPLLTLNKWMLTGRTILLCLSQKQCCYTVLERCAIRNNI